MKMTPSEHWRPQTAYSLLVVGKLVPKMQALIRAEQEQALSTSLLHNARPSMQTKRFQRQSSTCQQEVKCRKVRRLGNNTSGRLQSSAKVFITNWLEIPRSKLEIYYSMFSSGKIKMSLFGFIFCKVSVFICFYAHLPTVSWSRKSVGSWRTACIVSASAALRRCSWMSWRRMNCYKMPGRLWRWAWVKVIKADMFSVSSLSVQHFTSTAKQALYFCLVSTARCCL